MNELFPVKFLAALERLSVAINAAPPRVAAGTHLSARAGASLQFRDYQSYTPGDDLRRVDWAVYGRTRHLFVRRFDRPTAVPVHLLVDASASMHVEQPTRYAAAARVAAAIAAAALNSQNPVRCTIADGFATTMRPVTGRRGLVRVLAELARGQDARGPGVAASVTALLPHLAYEKQGVLVVLSDFFEPAGVSTLLDALRLVPMRLVLVRLTQRWDAAPDLAGDWRLADSESAAKLDVSISPELLGKYRQLYDDYFAALDTFASGRGARQASIDAGADVMSQLHTLFPAGVLLL